MIISLFINAGYHTVPLRGRLERLADGTKTLPLMEKDWMAKYTNEKNEEKVRLAMLLTGSINNIIAVDCDNAAALNIVKSIDPENQFYFESLGKEGGTFVYKYNPSVLPLRIHNEHIELDVFTDNGAIYLPTEENKTKVRWKHKELPELKEIPESLLALLNHLGKAKKVDAEKSKSYVANRLAPIVEQFVKNDGEYIPLLFKIITPREFRSYPEYVSKGHLHPNDIKEGDGSRYLSQISAILGADVSVSKNLYHSAMLMINNLWVSPMDKHKLTQTIINPMIEERAAIDNEIIWKYDESWEALGFVGITMRGDHIESFYDDAKGYYFIVNYTSQTIRHYTDKRKCVSILRSLTGKVIKEDQYDATKSLIRTILDPTRDFGHIHKEESFNMFRQTDGLRILNNPEGYSKIYKKPEITIKYLESLIPDEFMRNYILRFIRTRFTTFDYTPIIPYFIGVPGSGKDVFVTLLGLILGESWVTKVTTKVFLESQNGWLADTLVAHLDEYGDKLTRTSDKLEVLGKLKSYTGSDMTQLRCMATDAVNFRHRAIFILTANKNPLPIETDDRRVAFISTPNKLKEQLWVTENGGISRTVDNIKDEVIDFCYYLATEYHNLDANDYVDAPQTTDKEKLIVSGMAKNQQILHYIQNAQWEELIKQFKDFEVLNYNEGWDKGRLMFDKIGILYERMTEMKGDREVMKSTFRHAGYSRKHTTSKGENIYYWEFQQLMELAHFQDD